jgi:hypothetical protein
MAPGNVQTEKIRAILLLLGAECFQRARTSVPGNRGDGERPGLPHDILRHGREQVRCRSISLAPERPMRLPSVPGVQNTGGEK